MVEGAFTRDGGYEAARRLLLDAGRASSRPRPTCVFAVTDVMAVGALAALREAGLRVPEDVSLAGFDDIPLVRELSPPLTTVALPLTSMGESVIALALRETGAVRRARVVRVEGEVVLRGSTGVPGVECGDRGRPGAGFVLNRPHALEVLGGTSLRPGAGVLVGSERVSGGGRGRLRWPDGSSLSRCHVRQVVSPPWRPSGSRPRTRLQ